MPFRLQRRILQGGRKHFARNFDSPAALCSIVLFFAAVTLMARNGLARTGVTQDAAKADGDVVSVKVSNFSFDPKEVTVTVGTTVDWLDQGGRHTVTADDGSFKSATMVSGDHFKYRFDHPGVYRYYCSFHGSPGGKDMAGSVTVKESGTK